MKHPFIGDLSDLTIDELQTKLADLNSKITFAYRTQNSALIQQLHMAISSYKEEYHRKIDELISKNKSQTKIDITKK